MKNRVMAVVLVAFLGACGGAGDASRDATAAQESAGAPIALQKAVPSQKAPEPSLPQIAYIYNYGFRLRSAAVATVQETHVRLCEQLGPARCRIAKLERTASSGEYLSGTTTLLVAAPLARAVGDRIVATATQAGADTVERGIEGEDLSKQIVDTDARIRTKQALVDRLTVLLQTRSGNMTQAVEAERAINTAQEELEQARSWLAEMRGRVAMSTINLRYESAAPLGGGVLEPVRQAFADVGGLFGQSLGFIILLVAALLPWTIAAVIIFLGWRWMRSGAPPFNLRRQAEAPADAGSEPAP